VKETIRRLQRGHVLNIYPEGSRTGDGQIGPMEKGVAFVVRRAKVPVVPAVIVGSFEAWPVQRRFPRPWPIHVKYGPPMDLDGLEPDQILTTIDGTLRRMFEDLRADSASGGPTELAPPGGHAHATRTDGDNTHGEFAQIRHNSAKKRVGRSTSGWDSLPRAGAATEAVSGS
jgi:hypothetical protein